ncbi:unnamed protein product, partial [Discosporangium mesarthrocarpum]
PAALQGPRRGEDQPPVVGRDGLLARRPAPARPGPRYVRRALRLVGGVDISFVKGSNENACAALVVLSFPTLDVVYQAFESVTMDQPYISGFLAFREVVHLERLVKRLREERP